MLRNALPKRFGRTATSAGALEPTRAHASSSAPAPAPTPASAPAPAPAPEPQSKKHALRSGAARTGRLLARHGKAVGKAVRRGAAKVGKEVWFVLESMAIYFVIENGCMDCQDDPRLKCPGSRRRCNECSVYCWL